MEANLGCGVRGLATVSTIFTLHEERCCFNISFIQPRSAPRGLLGFLVFLIGLVDPDLVCDQARDPADSEDSSTTRIDPTMEVTSHRRFESGSGA